MRLVWCVELRNDRAEAIKHSNSILNQFHKLAGIDGIEWIVCAAGALLSFHPNQQLNEIQWR